ncbi:hypothetical protein [Parapedobacter sp. 10938]|uniref:hypothetical protein n=1 Tax=Parapedobacter flavus TaxID=3110225 RepID=UPI002DB6DE39|nr:hypothetical protein [Parapedobacter sp. 10938]MEC3879935.1 hypothetical protein [Parapedobacter sp. 10938]
MNYVMMKIRQCHIISVLAMLVIGFAAMSCSKDNDPAPENDEALKAEMGNVVGFGAVSGTPQGTPFRLPDGVVVDGTITGDDCADAVKHIGSGYYVTLCVALRNDKDQAITITLPGGLIIVSETTEYQHGVVLETTTIVLPPKTTTRFALHTYCGNANRDAADSEAVYTFGPLTNSKLLERLVNDLSRKKIEISDYWVDGTTTQAYDELEDTIQTLLWLITDTEESMDWETFENMYNQLLNDLPNK